MTCTASGAGLVLASGSPRRREILESAGLAFEVVVSRVTENPPAPNEGAGEYAMRMARLKAEAVSANLGHGIVLGADTVVVLSGAILGKPASVAEAVEMLRRLRDRDHGVTTGLVVVDSETGRVEAAAVASTVHMRPYDDDEIAAYVASGEPFDKAGGYAVQDPQFKPAKRVEGCYLNVVGLPLCSAADLLGRVGLPCVRERMSDRSGRCPGCRPGDGQREGRA